MRSLGRNGLSRAAAIASLCVGAMLAVIAAPAATLAGGGSKPVVELFTSQGCSTCPPADELLVQLAERRDIVALTYNVDYWDYLGWRDTLGKPEHSARQRAYAKTRGDGAVYTPQVVVDGRVHAVGSDKRTIDRLIKQSSSRTQSAPEIDLHQASDALVIRIAAAPDRAPAHATVYVAGIQPKATIAIKRGENRGRKITYANIVRRLVPVGMWDGAAKEIRVDPATIMGGKVTNCAVLLQNGDAGEIIAARWIDR